MGLPMSNRGNPAFSLRTTDKTLIPNLSVISDRVKDKQYKSTGEFRHSARNSLLQDERNKQLLRLQTVYSQRPCSARRA
jgi:hypothetical protein